MKKVIILVFCAVILISCLMVSGASAENGGKRYNWAIIHLANGRIVEGWLEDYSKYDYNGFPRETDAGCIELVVNGRLYFVHVTNVTLLDDMPV